MGISINTVVNIGIALGLNSIASLGGGLIPSALLHRHLHGILSCASGVLLGATFFDLIPEALELGGLQAMHRPLLFAALLSGFVLFYLIEAFLGSHATGQTAHRHDHAGPLLLVGDGLHNFADGVAIATAFLADPHLGWITTVGVVVHELPQEIADYAILISRGWSKLRALAALLVVQSTGFVGALAALLLSSVAQNATPLLLMASAGGFLYVAAADLLPSLHRKSDATSRAEKLAWLIAGVALMALMAGLHEH